jgi:hypothetical protein
VNYVCVCACDGAWNRDLVKMILPANSKCHNGKWEKSFPCVPLSCEGDGFWSRFFLSQFWPLSSSLVLPKGREGKFEGLKKGGRVGLDNSSCAVFEVLVCIVQKLEEIESFICGETSDCSIILVRMIFAGKLSIVDFNFGFRRSESETKNRE